MELHEITVGEIMTKKPITVGKRESITEIARLMKKYRVGSVIVVEGRKPVGIVTEGDIIRKVVAEGLDPRDIKAEDVMSTELVLATPDMGIIEAAETMQRKMVKRLPVVNRKGELVGIISETDITYVAPSLYEILRFRRELEEEELRMEEEVVEL